MTELVPNYLQTMRDITGTLETPGSSDNPVIMKWADEIAKRFPEMKLYCAQYTHDSIPWCGLTVGYVMAHNGIKPIYGSTDTDKFLWAAAWKQFGTEVDTPQFGDVLVFPGHVTLYDGEEDGYYLCRGGNQSDAVKVSKYPVGSQTAIRRPPKSANIAIEVIKPPVKPSADKVYTNITATVFGGSSDPNNSAYDNHEITDEEFGVALPYRFKGARPKVRVMYNGKSVDCTIVDVGPWNINDPYWDTKTRPQAESGEDNSGRATNKAGIDLTPAAAFAIGLKGKGIVDWMFIPASTPNVAKEEKVVRESSRKMRLFATVKNWIKALFVTASGYVTADNFGLFNSWLGIGNGSIPISTLLVIGVGGLLVWWFITTIDRMNMEDFRAGRWTPSELAQTEPENETMTNADDKNNTNN